MTTLDKLEELIYVGFKETDEKFKETDEKFKETDEKFKETNERFKETDQQLKARFQETDRRFREMTEELRKDFQKTRKEVANVTDALGRFSENMVAPALVRLLNLAGIPITETAQRVCSPLRRIEYDIVAVNQKYVVVVSVKTRLNVEHVKEFLERRLSIFKEVFPRYHTMQVLGAVAGMSIEQEADTYAIKRGLYVMTQSGDNITLLNPAEFQPRIF